MQQRLVLLIGLYVQRLIPIFRDLSAQVADRGLVFALGCVVRLGRCLCLFQLGFGPGELLLNGGDTFGKLRDFVLQPADFLIHLLQLKKVFYVRKHSALGLP